MRSIELPSHCVTQSLLHVSGKVSIQKNTINCKRNVSYWNKSVLKLSEITVIMPCRLLKLKQVMSYAKIIHITENMLDIRY